MSWRRGRTGLELVLPFEREKWFGEKKASRMMETFLLLLLLLLLLGCHLLLHRSDRGGGEREGRRSQTVIFTDSAENSRSMSPILNQSSGARWLAVSPSSQERSRLVTQLPATTRAHILLLLLSGRRDDGRTHTHTRGLPKSPSRP